jgi:hypothetical protein
MDVGATLVADDQVFCQTLPEGLMASVPVTIGGMLAIRDVGVFQFKEYTSSTMVVACVELTQHPERSVGGVSMLDVELPCLRFHNVGDNPSLVKYFTLAQDRRKDSTSLLPEDMLLKTKQE